MRFSAAKTRTSQTGWDRQRFLWGSIAAAAVLVALASRAVHGQVIGQYVQFEQVFGYKSNEPPKTFHVELVGSSAPGNVFWPGDEAHFDFQIINRTDQPLKAGGRWELIQYATRCQPIDPFAPPIASKLKDAGSTGVSIDIPAKGFVNQSVTLPLPAEFGTYAVVLAIDGQGRELAANCIRSVAATAGKEQFPAYACDIGRRIEFVPFFQRLGVKGTRSELGFFDPDDEAQWARLGKELRAMQDHDITVMLTVSTGGDYSKMPLGRIRGFLNAQGEGKMDYPGDFTILPQYDEAFQKWVRLLLERPWLAKGAGERHRIVERTLGGHQHFGLGRRHAALPRTVHAHGARSRRGTPGGSASAGRRRLLVDEHRGQAVSRRQRRAVSQVARLHQHSLPADVRRARAHQAVCPTQESARPHARVGHRKLDGQQRRSRGRNDCLDAGDRLGSDVGRKPRRRARRTRCRRSPGRRHFEARLCGAAPGSRRRHRGDGSVHRAAPVQANAVRERAALGVRVRRPQRCQRWHGGRDRRLGSRL